MILEHASDDGGWTKSDLDNDVPILLPWHRPAQQTDLNRKEVQCRKASAGNTASNEKAGRELAPSAIPNTAAAKFKFLSEEHAWTTRSPIAAPPMSMPDGMQQGKLQCWCRCPCCTVGGHHTWPVSCFPTGIAGAGQAAHLIPRRNPPFLSAEGACWL